MIETDDGGHLCDVSTVSTGFSDHCLLKARLNCGRERTPVTSYSYRDIKNMDVDSFRAYLDLPCLSRTRQLIRMILLSSWRMIFTMLLRLMHHFDLNEDELVVPVFHG